MDRQERLPKVLEVIERCANNERSFDTLYAKLLEEFDIETEFNNDLRRNHYLNNLRQTRDKQAHLYIETKKRRPVKGAPDEYRDFVKHFRYDVREATHLNPLPPKETTDPAI